MNTRFSLIALSIVIAVLSLAMVITVVRATSSNVNDAVIGIEAEADIRGGMGNRLLTYQRLNLSRDEPLPTTEPISIYLPLLENGLKDSSIERAALMALYNHTNGDEWINNAGWGTGIPYCGWYGVTCDENEHVSVLDLGGNGLTGTIPSEIGNLPMLTVLRLTGTWDCGYTPCGLSQLSGPLPSEIGNLVNLQELNLHFNQFVSLPPEVGNLASLQELWLSDNQFSSLPPEVGNLASLWFIDLSNNQLTSLPPEIGNLVNLQELWLVSNQLTSLPSEIGNLASLQSLFIGINQLTSLPPEIGNLASLQTLDLGWNQLSGPIPVFLSNLGNLRIFFLGGNYGLTCWETEEARDWAISLQYYDGPTCFFP